MFPGVLAAPPGDPRPWPDQVGVDSVPLNPSRRGEADSTMPRTKPTSPAESRARMIERVSAGRTLASMAKESGTSEMSVRGWDRQDDLETGRRTDGLPTEEAQELVRLREDSARLRVERDILKQAVVAWPTRSYGPLGTRPIPGKPRLGRAGASSGQRSCRTCSDQGLPTSRADLHSVRRDGTGKPSAQRRSPSFQNAESDGTPGRPARQARPLAGVKPPRMS